MTNKVGIIMYMLLENSCNIKHPIVIPNEPIGTISNLGFDVLKILPTIKDPKPIPRAVIRNKYPP